MFMQPYNNPHTMCVCALWLDAYKMLIHFKSIKRYEWRDRKLCTEQTHTLCRGPLAHSTADVSPNKTSKHHMHFNTFFFSFLFAFYPNKLLSNWIAYLLFVSPLTALSCVFVRVLMSVCLRMVDFSCHIIARSMVFSYSFVFVWPVVLAMSPRVALPENCPLFVVHYTGYAYEACRARLARKLWNNITFSLIK